MLEKSTQEIASREPESLLEEWGEHHNFLGIGCRDVLPSGRLPLEHEAIREKVILNQLEDLAFIHNRLLEHVWVGSGHDREEETLRWGIEASTGGGIAQEGEERKERG
jgi:hypothetical protein